MKGSEKKPFEPFGKYKIEIVQNGKNLFNINNVKSYNNPVSNTTVHN